VTQGHGIHVFQIPSHGNPQGNSGDLDPLFGEELVKEGNRGFSLGGRVGRKDDLLDGFSAEAAHQFADLEIFRPDAVQRRKHPVKDMIFPFESAGLLQGKLVARSFNDAQHSIGPGFIRADGAGIFVGEIEANGTEPDLLLHIEKAIGQVLGKVFGTPQNVKSHTGG